VTIGFHSPLPPAPTGVADYSAALLDSLRRRTEVVVNGDGAEVNLYHLGNNHLHREIYARALARPGVVVLHDAVIHHFFLGTLDERAYLEEFVYNYGEWTRGLAGELWRARSLSAQDPRYFDYPMLRRIAEASRAVVVHNPAAAAIVHRHAPGARVVEIPHLFVAPAPPAPGEVLRLRQRLGVPADGVLFGAFGHLRESKRLCQILRAFTRVRQAEPRAWLLVAGEFTSTDLARAIAPDLSQPGVIRRGYLPERDFWLHAAAVDACVNLRYPGAGETSGIAIRLMGIGKPLVVTAGEEYARFPEAACVRIDTGSAEQEMLTTCLLWLARNRRAAEESGRLAAAHVQAEHDLDRVAQCYLDALCACLSTSASTYP